MSSNIYTIYSSITLELILLIRIYFNYFFNFNNTVFILRCGGRVCSFCVYSLNVYVSLQRNTRNITKEKLRMLH